MSTKVDSRKGIATGLFFSVCVILLSIGLIMLDQTLYRPCEDTKPAEITLDDAFDFDIAVFEPEDLPYTGSYLIEAGGKLGVPEPKMRLIMATARKYETDHLLSLDIAPATGGVDVDPNWLLEAISE